MPDMFDSQKRSEIMAKVRGKDTTPELQTRRLLHAMGFRFRLNRTDLPGKPDIVLPKYRTVVFVNGCFWHGCPKCKHARVRPQNNADYWNKKLDRTIERDKENYKKLISQGWKVLVLWECAVKAMKKEQTAAEISEQIRSFLLQPDLWFQEI